MRARYRCLVGSSRRCLMNRFRRCLVKAVHFRLVGQRHPYLVEFVSLFDGWGFIAVG